MEEEATVHREEIDVPKILPVESIDSYTETKYPIYCFCKRLFDIICSVLALIILSVPMLIIALRIRQTSEGPAVFCQTRIGYHGKSFTIYKFRSMFTDADDMKKYLSKSDYAIYLKQRKLENDPRVTPLGHILRKTSLDELPQLLNILRGDMSLIGPRPLLEDEIKSYGSAYHLYIKLRPGLTGLWQVHSRSVTDISERSKMDAKYFTNRGFKCDLYIFFKTFGTVLSQKGAC